MIHGKLKVLRKGIFGTKSTSNSKSSSNEVLNLFEVLSFLKAFSLFQNGLSIVVAYER